MANKRKEIPELEKLLKNKKKKYVRVAEGAVLYSLGVHTFRELANEEYAINELTIKECIAIHAIENPESGRVIQKLGFSYEKEVPYECNGGEIKTIGKYYKFVAR